MVREKLHLFRGNALLSYFFQLDTFDMHFPLSHRVVTRSGQVSSKRTSQLSVDYSWASASLWSVFIKPLNRDEHLYDVVPS